MTLNNHNGCQYNHIVITILCCAIELDIFNMTVTLLPDFKLSFC